MTDEKLPPGLQKDETGQLYPAPGCDWADPHDPENLDVVPVEDTENEDEQSTAAVVEETSFGQTEPPRLDLRLNEQEDEDLLIASMRHHPCSEARNTKDVKR